MTRVSSSDYGLKSRILFLRRTKTTDAQDELSFRFSTLAGLYACCVYFMFINMYGIA